MCGHSANKFFRSAKDAVGDIKCDKCDRVMARGLKAPASTSTVIVDNGVQARATEVNLEVVEDIKARSTKDFTEK